MKRFYFFSFLFFILISLNPAFAKNKCEQLNIAILDFDPKDVSVQEAKKITELIRVEIIRTNCFVVIERSKMNEILKEQGFQQTGCVEESCAVQVGKLLSAKKILIGTIMKFDEDVVITARIIDVERGTADASEKEYYKRGSIAEMNNAIERLASKFIGIEISKKDQAPKKEKSGKKKSTAGGTINPCGWVSISFLAVSGAGAGVSIYYNDLLGKKNKSYDRLKAPYYLTTNQAAALYLHYRMKNLKHQSDDLATKRNAYAIAAGSAGGVALSFAIAAIYYHVAHGGETSLAGLPVPADFMASPIFMINHSPDGKRGSLFTAGIALQRSF